MEPENRGFVGILGCPSGFENREFGGIHGCPLGFEFLRILGGFGVFWVRFWGVFPWGLLSMRSIALPSKIPVGQFSQPLPLSLNRRPALGTTHT